MKFSKIVTVVAAVSVVSMAAACGSDDSDSDATPASSSASSTAVEGSASSGEGSATGALAKYESELTNSKKRPSAAALDTMLKTALDAKVPNSQKVDLVQNSEADPKLFDQLVKVAKENPDVTYKIKPPVLSAGPNKGTVKVEVKLPNNPTTKLDATIVFDKGRWKLASQTVCPLLSQGNVKSPMCKTAGSTSTSKKKAA